MIDGDAAFAATPPPLTASAGRQHHCRDPPLPPAERPHAPHPLLPCLQARRRVVFACTDDEGVTFAPIYSSEAAAWSSNTFIEHHDATVGVDTGTSVLVGNTLYFPCNPSTRIVEYDLDKRGLSMIDPPFAYGMGKVLMAAEGGGPGLAGVRGSSLYLLSRVAAGPNGAVAWAQRRVINLEPLLAVRALSTSPFVIGFADSIGVIFLGTGDGIFTIELKSGRVNKVYKRGRSIEKVIPYMSFYTRGCVKKNYTDGVKHGSEIWN